MSEAVFAGSGPGLAPRPIGPKELTDRAALRHIVDAYGHGIDRRDYALLATLYHDDALDDHSPYFCGPARDYIAAGHEGDFHLRRD